MWAGAAVAPSPGARPCLCRCLRCAARGPHNNERRNAVCCFTATALEDDAQMLSSPLLPSVTNVGAFSSRKRVAAGGSEEVVHDSIKRLRINSSEHIAPPFAGEGHAWYGASPPPPPPPPPLLAPVWAAHAPFAPGQPACHGGTVHTTEQQQLAAHHACAQVYDNGSGPAPSASLDAFASTSGVYADVNRMLHSLHVERVTAGRRAAWAEEPDDGGDGDEDL